MHQDQRPREELRSTPGPGAATPLPGGQLTAMAAHASALAAASQGIINAALSGDSQAFLRATRQAGGQ